MAGQVGLEAAVLVDLSLGNSVEVFVDDVVGSGDTRTGSLMHDERSGGYLRGGCGHDCRNGGLDVRYYRGALYLAGGGGTGQQGGGGEQK